ncbi:MAG: thioredoxin-disulfide reductase [Thermoplasmatota archaeon]
MDTELAIIGAGAAGYTAAIYAGRAGIDAVVFDKGAGGGLSTWAPRIENYPGFQEISGVDLMDKMKDHAEPYAAFRYNEAVTDIQQNGDGFKVTTTKDSYTAGAVIICTGTTPRQLDVPGENKLRGRGVSYCATCDGSFFKDKKVAVVGGGNSAVNEAIYLDGLGADVSIIHRRDRLRAEEALAREIDSKDIEVIWNSVVEAIKGDTVVEKLSIKNRKTGETTEQPFDGVFISVGEQPQSSLAETLGVATDDHGYIKTGEGQRTNIDGVYAAGDITGGVRQVITACAEGATAALTSMHTLGKSYPF